MGIFDNTMKVKVTVTFTEAILGMMPTSENIYADYIASKAPDAKTIEEEIEEFGTEEIENRGKTVFPRENGKPFLFDYQIKGWMKDCCGLLRVVPGSESSKVKAYKKILNGLFNVVDRKNFITVNGDLFECPRPLRASTPQGERVSLANSEAIPAGSSLSFVVELLDKKYLDLLLEWLDYGTRRGFGQWRNGGYGRFMYEYSVI